MRICYLAFLGTLLFGLACATTSNLNSNVSYMQTAKQNFELGEKALQESRHQEAIAYFDYVKSKFPYTQYAALSDLKIADSYAKEEKWPQAAESYNLFVRFHPRHEQVAYALFQAANAYFEAMPKDFFLFPKAYTKDQQASKDALSTLNRYLEQFPDGEYAAKAKEMKEAILTQLALADFAVAEYNEEHKRFSGAVARYERIANLYPDTEIAPKALHKAHILAKNKLKDAELSERLSERLLSNYPNSSFAKLIQGE